MKCHGIIYLFILFVVDYGDAGGGGGGINPLALLVAPLAGIALLSAAAAVALNPVLVSISVTNGKRKKREAGGEYDNDLIQQYMTADMEEKIEEMKVINNDDKKIYLLRT